MIWRISAEWQTEDIRHTLINAVAGFLGAVTVQDPRTSHNCWWQPDGTKACNVGDVVRVSRSPHNIYIRQANMSLGQLANLGKELVQLHERPPSERLDGLWPLRLL
jgi:hypothetical protein